jgi:hypothetical protein
LALDELHWVDNPPLLLLQSCPAVGEEPPLRNWRQTKGTTVPCCGAV